MRAFALLANGMGGLDWSGLPAACEYLGVEDPADLIHRLEIIKRFVATRNSDEVDDARKAKPDHHHGDRQTLD